MKIELVIELTIAPEINPYRGEQTDASEVEWFEEHLLGDELIQAKSTRPMSALI